MKKPQFRLRDLLWLTLLCASALLAIDSYRSHQRERRALERISELEGDVAWWIHNAAQEQWDEHEKQDAAARLAAEK